MDSGPLPGEHRQKFEQNGQALPTWPKMWTADELQNADLPEPKFSIPGILAQGLGILGGKPKTGKSWQVLDLGIAIASGGRALGSIEVEQGDVLYLALEDTPRRLQDRQKKLLEGREAPKRLTVTCEWPRMDEGGMDLLVRWCEEHPEARLIGIDTLARVKPRTAGKDLYSEDYRTGEQIKKLADRYSLTVLVVHHLRKMDADDPLDLLSGTLGLPGAADTGLILRRTRGQNIAKLFITGRDVEERELALKWSPTNGRWNIEGDADEVLISDQRREILATLKKAGGTMGPKEIHEITGLPYGSVRMLLPQMVEDNLLDNPTRGKYKIIDSVDNDDKHDIDNNASLGTDEPGLSIVNDVNDVFDIPGEQQREIQRLIKQGFSAYAARAQVLASDHPLDCDCEVCE